MNMDFYFIHYNTTNNIMTMSFLLGNAIGILLGSAIAGIIRQATTDVNFDTMKNNIVMMSFVSFLLSFLLGSAIARVIRRSTTYVDIPQNILIQKKLSKRKQYRKKQNIHFYTKYRIKNPYI